MKKSIHVVMVSVRGHSFNSADRVYKAFYDEWEASDIVSDLSDKINRIKLDDENRNDKYFDILGISEDYGSVRPSLYIVCGVDLCGEEKHDR